jgi:hypothetical protein
MSLPKCLVCDLPIIVVSGIQTHPGCDPTLSVWRAFEAKREGMAQAELSNPAARDDALKIIHDAAIRSETLSANTVRFQMNAMCVPGQVRGPAWSTAVTRGWVVPIGESPSTDRATHAKRVQNYSSALYVRTSA